MNTRTRQRNLRDPRDHRRSTLSFDDDMDSSSFAYQSSIHDEPEPKERISRPWHPLLKALLMVYLALAAYLLYNHLR